MYIKSKYFSGNSSVQREQRVLFFLHFPRFFRRGTRYIVGAHDMWWIVVEIYRGKHDSTSWISTQHTYNLCNRFKK